MTELQRCIPPDSLPQPPPTELTGLARKFLHTAKQEWPLPRDASTATTVKYHDWLPLLERPRPSQLTVTDSLSSKERPPYSLEIVMAASSSECPHASPIAIVACSQTANVVRREEGFVPCASSPNSISPKPCIPDPPFMARSARRSWLGFGNSRMASDESHGLLCVLGSVEAHGTGGLEGKVATRPPTSRPTCCITYAPAHLA